MKVKIFGQVQKVGFRYFTVKVAKKIGVKGYVRNEVDGTVFVEAVANKPQLESFLIELQENSPGEISKCEVHWEDTTNNYIDFKIF